MRVRIGTGESVSIDKVQIICRDPSLGETGVSWDGGNGCLKFTYANREFRILPDPRDGSRYRTNVDQEGEYPWICVGKLASSTSTNRLGFGGLYGTEAYVRRDDVDIRATMRSNSPDDRGPYALVLKSGLFASISGSLRDLAASLGSRIPLGNPMIRMFGSQDVHVCSIREVRMFPIRELGIKLVTVFKSNGRWRQFRSYPIRRRNETILRSLGLSPIWFRKKRSGDGTAYMNRRYILRDTQSRLDYDKCRYIRRRK